MMNCTGKHCIMQFDKVDPATCKCVSYCPQATPPKTNVDRIRSMTDEELAAHMVLSVENALLHFANIRLQGDALSEYIAYWICWLKQESEGE